MTLITRPNVKSHTSNIHRKSLSSSTPTASRPCMVFAKSVLRKRILLPCFVLILASITTSRRRRAANNYRSSNNNEAPSSSSSSSYHRIRNSSQSSNRSSSHLAPESTSSLLSTTRSSSFDESSSFSLRHQQQSSHQEQHQQQLPSKIEEALRFDTFFTARERLSRPTIHVVGERHSGTKWITDHLDECFGAAIKNTDSNRTDITSDGAGGNNNDNNTASQQKFAVIKRGLSRWKHWFQTDNKYYYRIGTPAIVVVQFRHVLQWTKAMQVDPYHAPHHFNLSWKEYVKRPWSTGVPMRTGRDVSELGLSLSLNASTKNNNHTEHGDVCQYNFAPHQVVPCLVDGKVKVHNYREVYPCYELKPDGSGQPYSSILDLRRDKIKNFLSIKNFEGIDGLFIVHYEQMVRKGTHELIRKIERSLNLTAKCQPSEPHDLSQRPLPYKYVNYIKENADWEAESMIGYKFEWDHNKYAQKLQRQQEEQGEEHDEKGNDDGDDGDEGSGEGNEIDNEDKRNEGD